jgi:hypothetical protein
MFACVKACEKLSHFVAFEPEIVAFEHGQFSNSDIQIERQNEDE